MNKMYLNQLNTALTIAKERRLRRLKNLIALLSTIAIALIVYGIAYDLNLMT